ncbi:hypothetical protein ACQP25_29370 [Microtetraspora malaysiensis]|uniref:hypothetical protein n=1 Tax=Microtetraspora malaysiensis TaxID=161358 RepID=UPI003D947BD5
MPGTAVLLDAKTTLGRVRDALGGDPDAVNGNTVELQPTSSTATSAPPCHQRLAPPASTSLTCQSAGSACTPNGCDSSSRA